MLNTDIIVGARVPKLKLGYLRNDVVATVDTSDLFANGKSVVIGIPGAFSPVCATQHIPDFLANADRLTASGFGQLLCIAPNDPFVLEAWRGDIDPERKLRFLSDGNLEFARALGLSETNTELFLGARSMRYMLIIQDQIIQRVRVESSILTYTCTRADDVLIAA